MKAQAITPSVLRKYIDKRLKERSKSANASVNRELAYVRRALNLGAQEDPPLVLRVPHFEMLPEDNVREGVLAHDQYRSIRDLLPGYARIALVIAYHTGARKGEIRKIQVNRIDFKAARIELPGRTTKNSRPRYLPIYGDMAAELEIAIEAGAEKTGCPFWNGRRRGRRQRCRTRSSTICAGRR